VTVEGPDRDLLEGRTILAVFAHPDDESLACGGTLARAADAGARVVLLCASRGTRGPVSDRSLLPDNDVGVVRVRELHEAAAVLGVAEVIALDHPDGSLRWADVPELHGEIVDAVRRLRPDAVITFGEDGLYWYLDHVGIYERTYTAVLSLGPDAPPLYYVTLPLGAMRQIVDAARARGAPPDVGFLGVSPDAFGVATDPPDFLVDVGPWVGRKLAALRCHRTQLGARNPFTWIGEHDARRWLSIEQFQRAPIESKGERVLERLGRPVDTAESTA
jgi:N-acetylglucosamine malate deacetylase 2